MSGSVQYLRVPTDGDLEMEPVNNDGDRPNLERQVSSTTSVGSAETGRRVRQMNDRRRERLNTELLIAVSQFRNAHEVKRLLEKGASGRACCRFNGTSAVHIAASLGHVNSLCYLLEAGGDARAKDEKGREPAHVAAWNNKFHALGILHDKDHTTVNCSIEKGEYVEDQDNMDSWNHNHQNLEEMIPIELENGVTPLHIASMRGHHESVRRLIQLGADINSQTSRHVTPIDVAGLYLAEKVQTASKEGFSPPTPVLFARGEPIIVGRRLCRKNQAKIPSSFEREAKMGPLIRIYQDLMSSGATLPKGRTFTRTGTYRSNVQTKKTTTPLHTAVAKGDLEGIKFLLDKGACLMAWNSEEDTALHLAVREMLIEPLKTMLFWNFDQLDKPGSDWESKIDVRNGQGLTPLLLAAKLQWADGVAILLEEGADVTATSIKNETVLTFAARHGDACMMKEFLTAPKCSTIIERRDDQNYTPVCYAVEHDSLACLKLLSEHGANLAITLPGNVTMLHTATEIDSPTVIEFLLQDQATKQLCLVDKVCKVDKGGLAPLHIAALRGYQQCALELIKGGCNVGVRTMESTHRSQTALHLAAHRGHKEVLDLILSRDIKAHEARDDDFWTPLHVAAARAHGSCVRSLLWCGADLGAAVRDESGKKTAVDLIMLCIPQPVDFLEEILDSYVTLEGESLNDESSRIEIKFDILVPNDRQQRQLKVMNALLNSGKIDTIQRLLLHPLIETFLHLKWKKLRMFFVVIALLYVIQTVSLTVYAHLMYIERSTSRVQLYAANIASILLISVDIIILFLEMMNLIQLQRHYVKDIESLVKWGMIATSFTVGLADPTFSWTKYVAATAVLLSWLELLFLLARWPGGGYYVHMFYRVALNVLKVLGTFTLLFIGFSFTFLILFEATEPFGNFFEAFIKVLVMMLEFDYQNMFEPVKDVKALSTVGRVIFVTFVILVSIVMMNLMLGLAVSDISALEAQGKTQYHVKQTQFLSLLEMVVYNRTLKKLLPPKIYEAFEGKRAVDEKIIVRPAKPIEVMGHSLPKKLRESVIDYMWAKVQPDDVQVTINLQDINQKIDDLAVKIRDSSSKSSSSDGRVPIEEVLARLDEIQEEQMAIKHKIGQLMAPRVHEMIFDQPETSDETSS